MVTQHALDHVIWIELYGYFSIHSRYKNKIWNKCIFLTVHLKKNQVCNYDFFLSSHISFKSYYSNRYHSNSEYYWILLTKCKKWTKSNLKIKKNYNFKTVSKSFTFKTFPQKIPTLKGIKLTCFHLTFNINNKYFKKMCSKTGFKFWDTDLF